jgi:hypothetical protein
MTVAALAQAPSVAGVFKLEPVRETGVDNASADAISTLVRL